jgi:predicted component of type VI protein secretion system
MIKRTITILSLVLVLAFLAGCAAHVHTIGKGPQGSTMTQERQWYILWGLVPLNQVDTKVMAGNTVNYQIRTEASALDVIINLFTSAVTVSSRTVTVTK